MVFLLNWFMSFYSFIPPLFFTLIVFFSGPFCQVGQFMIVDQDGNSIFIKPTMGKGADGKKEGNTWRYSQ